MFGFYRVASIVPSLALADPMENGRRLASLARQASNEGAAVLLFPELSLTGYTCGDLFYQHALLDAAETAIAELASATKDLDCFIAIGAPLRFRSRLYNSAVLLQKGRVLGAVPKSHLPNYREFYEKRWFDQGRGLSCETIEIAGQAVAFGSDLLFSSAAGPTVGIEICEDLWSVVPPSSLLAAAGAEILLNLSASNELVAKSEYRHDLVKNQSARCVAAYAYCSAGWGESTTDLVYGGHAMIAENGSMLAESARFARHGEIIYADVDVQRLQQTRISETSYREADIPAVRHVAVDTLPEARELRRSFPRHPFVPENPELRDRRCEEIFNIQASALARRLGHIGSNRCVIGVSGGLDSTLALLVAIEAQQRLHGKNSDIIAITMPGFGTSERTYSNAAALCRKLDCDFRDISIVTACEQHFSDIGHDPDKHDVTYENVQARERTQLLMNIANKENGIVVGTGDLSEIALGWSTYNGDHMSMYAVNCGVPKTLIRYLVAWVADHSTAEVRKVLLDILDTPITPELLPGGKDGEASQHTEQIIGPYELHDFFLYHIVKYGAAPDKVLHLAQVAFAGKYELAQVRNCLATFIRRFFTQQFKRSCMPDGPKVGTISLSPRGDWRMPSDAVYTNWAQRIGQAP